MERLDEYIKEMEMKRNKIIAQLINEGYTKGQISFILNKTVSDIEKTYEKKGE